jgi:hypothetical protein
VKKSNFIRSRCKVKEKDTPKEEKISTNPQFYAENLENQKLQEEGDEVLKGQESIIDIQRNMIDLPRDVTREPTKSNEKEMINTDNGTVEISEETPSSAPIQETNQSSNEKTVEIVQEKDQSTNETIKYTEENTGSEIAQENSQRLELNDRKWLEFFKIIDRINNSRKINIIEWLNQKQYKIDIEEEQDTFNKEAIYYAQYEGDKQLEIA